MISAATKTNGAAFHPGSGEIEFDGAGYLWVVAEAGSALYPTQFFPVIAKLDPSKIDAGASSKCKVGM